MTTVRILGCGSSAGVPLIGCECAVCTSANPKNNRTRASILIENAGRALLVDASPDLRQQALREHLSRVDALFITHAHADHCHGIDDVRSFNYHLNDVLPLHSDAATLNELQSRFAYVFQPPSHVGWIRAALVPHVTRHAEPFEAAGLRFTPFLQHHGDTASFGLRLGNVAYSTDVNHFPSESEPFLHGLDVWIVDCLRISKAPTHAHLDLTLEWIARYRPKRAILTHMTHDFDYEALRKQLPDNVEPAYDGLSFDC